MVAYSTLPANPSPRTTVQNRNVTPRNPTELDCGPYASQNSYAVRSKDDVVTVTSHPIQFAIIAEAIALGRALLSVPRVQLRIAWALRQNVPEDQTWTNPDEVGPPRVPKPDPLMQRRINEWLNGNNSTVFLFEPTEEERDLDGYTPRLEPKKLGLNYHLVQAAEAALTRLPDDPATYYRHAYHLGVVIFNESMHSMRRVIKEAAPHTPPQIRAGAEDPANRGKMLHRDDGWYVTRGEGAWWAEQWALGGAIFRDLMPSLEALYPGEIRRLVAQSYHPDRESYFGVRAHVVSAVVQRTGNWQQHFPLKALDSESVELGCFSNFAPYNGTARLSDSSVDTEQNRPLRGCAVPSTIQ